MRTKREIGFRVLMLTSTLLLCILLAGQTLSLFNYELVVSWGLQESVDEVIPFGIAWLKAFALGDTLSYIPLLVIGIVGMLQGKRWGFYAMFASLAISVYWPIVNLSAIYLGKNEIAMSAEKYTSFSIILPLITIYGLWGMWYLYRYQSDLSQ